MTVCDNIRHLLQTNTGNNGHMNEESIVLFVDIIHSDATNDGKMDTLGINIQICFPLG